jgi:potassium-dependent mechanosensitive channel
MRRFITSYILLLTGFVLFAQTNPLPSSIVPKQTVVSSDSLKTEDVIVKKVHRKLNMALDTLTLSDYTLSLERVNDNLNAIGDSSKLGFQVDNIANRIDFMTVDVKLIRQNFKGRHSVGHIKNQYLYQNYTSLLADEADRIQDQLGKMYRRVYHSKLRLKKVLADSIFRKLYANKELRTTFDDKLNRLEGKWNRTDSVTKANLDTLNSLKVRLSDNSLILSNMLNIMDRRLDKSFSRLFGQEVNSLWQKEESIVPSKANSKNPISTFKSEQNAIHFYVIQTSGERKVLILLGILLFGWLFINRKLLKTLKRQKDIYSYLNLQYLNSYPVISMFVLLLCLMPFFDAYAPTSYISIEYIFLLLASTVILFKNNDQKFKYNWIALVALFVADILIYLLMEPTLIERLLQIAVHGGVIVFLIRFNKSLNMEMPYFKFIKTVVYTGVFLSGMGIIFNVFGRSSLSGILGVTAIIAVTHVIILTIFVEVIVEIVLVQLQSSRLKKDVDKPFDSTVVTKKIKVPLIIVALIIWSIMFSSNLNVYHNLSNYIVEALTITRSIGSISYQLISVILFFIIIWFAHILQRLLSFLFGETGVDNEDMSTATKGQHSRLLITRLLVLIGGYMLAIAASGLPIDKLTFLLGALGVGIGMGLQGIVNNFVSGIILIFDGSLQIGDEIEVSGQAGKVKEIGLRASTLFTADGAEVIIPNGNILSQNIVNWTFNNDEKRIILSFSLTGKELDANVMNEIINETIKEIPNVISNRKPVILYTKVAQDTCTITVRFWSKISHTDLVKSEAMLQLSAAFAAKNIGFE